MRLMLAQYHPHETIMPVGINRVTRFHEHYPHVLVDAPIEHGRRITAQDAKPYSVIFGHYDWHLAENLPDWDVMVMLREPVAQLQSLYRYMQGQQYRRMYPWIADADFATWVRHPQIQHLLNNQTAYLSGHHRRDGVIALENLRSERVTIGLVERYAESVAIFNRKFGWDLRMLHENRTQGEVVISDALRGEVERLQRHDVRLYQEACRLFENQLRVEGNEQ